MVGPRVLVTGATGGLGRVLVPALRSQGCDVLATGRRASIGAQLEGAGVRFSARDLTRDPLQSLLHGVDTVFHLAALSSPWGRRADFVAANVTATLRLLDAAHAAGCARFIHVSTPSIYTDAREQLSITEASPLPRRLANQYAQTKLDAERIVLAASSPAFASVVLRPRAIVSPFDTVLLPRLLRATEGGRVLLPAGGRAMVELTDARDVVTALLAARDRAEAVSGEAFNISGGAPRPLAEIVLRVCDTLGRPLRIVPVPAGLALKFATLAEAIARRMPSRPEPSITRYGAMVAGWSQTFDLTAARTRLGWRPTHSPEDALAWALSERVRA